MLTGNKNANVMCMNVRLKHKISRVNIGLVQVDQDVCQWKRVVDCSSSAVL